VKPKAKIGSSTRRIVFNPNRVVITDDSVWPFESRSGQYAHFCYEFDDMLIDETDIKEFASCNCGKPNPKT